MIKTGQRKHHPQRKHTVLRVKYTKSTVLRSDGADAAAAVAVTILTGDGKTVPHAELTGVWVLNLDEELVAPNAAVQFSPDATCTRAQIVCFLYRWKNV